MSTQHPEITDATQRVPAILDPMKTRFLVVLFAVVSASIAHAGPRTSASYSITTDTADGGGTRTTSASYTNDGSAGGVTGLSTVAAPAETAKSGYIGQLYEVTALQLAASPTTIDETSTRHLGASQLLDDATTIGVNASSVSWSVLSGPISSIDTNGLATAAAVYQDTAAQAQGSYAGMSSALNLNVLDTIADNFGTYASDGIDDAWQTLYFGANNPNAAPNYISDGSGLTNLFKYTAGLMPNNAASTFLLNNAAVTGQPGQRQITLGPTFSDRTYTIEFSLDLGRWDPLGASFTGNGGTQIVTDADASGPRKFYRVSISRP